MAYSKKSLLVFSTVALSTAAIAGFFIRQKVLNDWKIAEFNDLLKQIKELEVNIDEDEKYLKNNERLKTITEEKNQVTKKQIKELEESIDKNSKKLLELNNKKTFNKTAKGIQTASTNNKELKKQIKKDINSKTLQTWNELMVAYERILSNYIDYKQNILKQIQKYSDIKEKEIIKKENLDKEIQENEKSLSELKNLISKLTKNIEDKKSKLIILKNSRKKEREREQLIKYIFNKIFDWHFFKKSAAIFSISFFVIAVIIREFFIKNKIISDNLYA